MRQEESPLWGEVWHAPASAQQQTTPLVTPVGQQPAPEWGSPNPMVRQHGPGPDGTTCASCRFRVVIMLARSYSKCQFLPKGGRTTALKLAWPACRRYEPGEPSFVDGR